MSGWFNLRCNNMRSGCRRSSANPSVVLSIASRYVSLHRFATLPGVGDNKAGAHIGMQDIIAGIEFTGSSTHNSSVVAQPGTSAMEPGIVMSTATELSVADDDPVHGLERLKQRLDGIIDGWEEPSGSGATAGGCARLGATGHVLHSQSMPALAQPNQGTVSQVPAQRQAPTAAEAAAAAQGDASYDGTRTHFPRGYG